MLATELPAETLTKLGRDLRFIGTFHVVYGAIQCLSIIGAVIGIPYILFGLRSRDSGEQFVRYSEMADDVTLVDAHRHLASGAKMLKIACFVTTALLVAHLLFLGFVIVSILNNPFLRAMIQNGG